MSIEIIDSPRDNEEKIQYIYASDDCLFKLVKPNKTGYILCQCNYGETCLNNPNKKLIGLFNLCKIKIRKF